MSIELSEEQVLYFRARRAHLAGAGAANAAAAAREILGAQAQQLAPALWALSVRTKGRPTAAALKARLFGARRDLVRTWGQRETLHVYDPAADWAAVAAARAQWAPGGRRGPMPEKDAVDKAAKLMVRAQAPVTRSDLLDVAPRSYVRALEPMVGRGSPAIRLAAGRLLWHLALRGEACVAEKVGTEQAYASRSVWFPRLPWPKKCAPAVVAATDLTRRYLATYGPATVTDVAHFFGARVREARVWIDALRAENEIVEVGCGDRKRLLALAADARALRVSPPSGVGDWPIRLLPLWDSMLMGHADKSWSVPDADDRKVIWRRGAFVAAVALARGRVVAVWSHAPARGRLTVTVTPLSGWRASKHGAGVRREAEAVSAHLELGGVDLTIE